MERKVRSGTRPRVALTVAALAVAALAVAALAGCSAGAGGGSGSVRGCSSYAYQAIRSHTTITALPAACRGLSPSEVNDAASMAIRQAAGVGDKSEWRKQAAAAAPWVSALITEPVAVASGPGGAGLGGAGLGGASPGGASLGGASLGGGSAGGYGLGGVSELAVRVAALLAWLATVASGGYVLARWLRAGGKLRRQAPGAAPVTVIVGHVGFALAGLVLWACFMLTGWIALAWTATGLLGPVAGAGMGVLILGLPRPVRPPSPSRPQAAAETGQGGTATLVAQAPHVSARPRMPVFVIAAHGLFAALVLLLVMTATIGAG